jgi:amino acid transporter
MIAERKQMKPITLLGILFLVMGGLALAYHGINYTHTEKVIDLGPIHATKDTHKRIPPPILGGIALLSGGALLAAGTRKKA